MNLKYQAFAVARRCMDAYSADAYRRWSAVALLLLREGFTEREAEAIMRSKWTRWARDASEKNYRYGEYPAKILVPMLPQLRKEAARLANETFGTSDND